MESRDDLLEKIADLRDRLKNGIRYDEELNLYVVVWTKRQIEQANKEADELMKFFSKTTKKAPSEREIE